MSFIREADEEPIPGYRLIRPLGSGGFGEVWLCEAPGQIMKAIKFVFGSLDASATGDGRARQEFHAIQRVKEVRHPFVLSIERIDILDGEVVMVMELAEKSLHDVLQEARTAGQPGIPRDKLLKYMADTAEGLDYLSEAHNVMHMDVKPRNLFLIGDHVKVADFGLARHLERQSSSGILAGISPQYAAPETFTSRITKHSDQYSVAIVYMEMLTGRRPFNGKTIRELALQHMNVEPDLSPLPERDRRAVYRALSKDPFKRFPNSRQFIEALSGMSGGGLPVYAIAEDVSSKELDPESAVLPATKFGGIDASVDPEELRATLHLPPAGEKPPKPVLDPVSPPKPVIEPVKTKAEPAKPRLESIKSLPAIEPIEPSKVEYSQQVNFDFPVAGDVLRPTIIIGYGSFGLACLRELRSRLTDRLGDLRQIPMFRFMYADADPDAKTVGMAGSPDRALAADQIFPTPLQPITRYRKGALELLSEWMPREKLHAIPRTMNPQGSRALGRLAFTENYLRFVTRLRREIELATHPESLTLSGDHSGLPVRDHRPRIFVLCAAGGASSGALPDIGYSIAKLFGQLKLPVAVHAMLFLGSPADPTTPPDECANVYATLSELNHYADETITFQSRYGGPDGPQVESQDRPFSSIYLIQRGARGPTAVSECAERLASYLTLDLTTPMGADLDRSRAINSGEVFRSFGTGGLWYPRGLLLRAASRMVGERMIQIWQSQASAVSPAVAEFCHRVISDPNLKPERVSVQIEEAIRTVEAVPGDQVTGLLGNLEQKIDVGGATGVWAREAFDAVMNLVGVKGSRDPADAVRTGKLTKAYVTAVNNLGDRWLKVVAREAVGLIEKPGRRVAAAEGALGRLAEYCERTENDILRGSAEFTRRSEQAFAVARAAAEVCYVGGGFSLFGNRDQKNMRALLAALSNYAQQRTQEETHAGVIRFFRKVKAGLEDKQRDLSICRQRLSNLKQALEIPETGGASCYGESPIVQILLPDGGEEIEWAAKRFVEVVKPVHVEALDQTLQSLVLEPRGGLFAVCQKSGEYIQELAEPLIDQTAAYLGTLLPVNDVAEFAKYLSRDWDQRLKKARDRATPTVTGHTENERAYLVVPETAAGEQVAISLGLDPRRVTLLRSSRSNEIVFVREVMLKLADVRETLHYCREAYEERVNRPAASPHARFDVVEWVPLDV
ncbi:protein kinase domain-containing protein [Zavarzinella formosa]|uniref:protein kinase domain-containing protein n=1 Tax=Zavarzinella formosa TaxID=360055 RepID=UPI0003113804|nr:tubulin-like doman-containing protein [Zavarzinella formosa]